MLEKWDAWVMMRMSGGSPYYHSDINITQSASALNVIPTSVKHRHEAAPCWDKITMTV
ncbi:hypothetical protein KCP73_06640 [Salmonella enterica subsp. enterica]|nr:hypothetical protein KCP73_06640 [Salmonella enterica subsp. enterica]